MAIHDVTDADRQRALHAVDASAGYDGFSSPMMQTTLAVVYRALFNRAARQLPTPREPASVDVKRRAAGDRD
ncbi:hypothetical protein [Pandoraea terrigena]|uniref:Uncharacterized protein n=1 Tax=Pandoraea terrigena TaxID=2508292 RepID=A0A5E4YD97_9BURK|nr:hypothetical protein [Pandoraea terrigena]VVE46726.1 hypothetical protein PTE31013_04478 [Pandoraea terrigena]